MEAASEPQITNLKANYQEAIERESGTERLLSLLPPSFLLAAGGTPLVHGIPGNTCPKS